MPIETTHAVFLSYAREDTAAAQRLADALRAAGVEVWFDQNELRSGDLWDQKIRRQIKECELFIPIISASTQARAEGYFRREWKLAADRTQDMADHVAFLLPVVIDSTPDATAFVPEKFREVQWTRIHGADAEAAFAMRVATLLGAASTAEPASPLPAQTAARPLARATPAGQARQSKRRLAALAAVVLLGLAATLAWYGQRNARLRRMHETMLPEIERLIATRKLGAAFDLAVAAEREAPDDGALKALWSRIAVTTSVETTPAGADVYVKEYYKPQAEWRHLGKTPLPAVRLPKVYTRWKVQREGSVPLEQALGVEAPIRFNLDPANAIPADMVKVGAGNVMGILTGLATVKLDDFLIDRFEVTNRQFKAFVDQHGYGNRAFWKQPFVRAGKALGVDEALAEFHDSTGRPGPATWKDGSFPESEADFPVTGISWYEAAAYAEFVGKRLPSIYHWRVAAQVAEFESLVPLSNIGSRGLARVGVYQGMSAWGAYDMAGNVKEWCWNTGAADTRYALGGAWRDAPYVFAQREAQAPFDRSPNCGFRCMRVIGSSAVPPERDAALITEVRNYTEEKPVSDEVYRAFRGSFSYDKSPLDVRVEAVDEADPRWRREKISFRAAYGSERVPVYVFLPKVSTPPFQAVVYYPTGGAQIFKTLAEDDSDMSMVAMLVASGRAVICPIYKGTFERYERFPAGSTLSAFRDQLVMIVKDLGRTIDYLETRADLQPGKLAFFGYSTGGTQGTILPAVEVRLKASVFVAGGFFPGKSLPEADPINYAPRNTVPTLMLNGRYDFVRPVETSQLPMFRLLGAPPDQKRHVLFDTGHTLKPEQIVSEVYTWLDRYLGLVK